MASVLSGLSGVKPFNVHEDRSSLGQRWNRWISQFELYVLASGVSDDAQKRALLLHMSGPDVQDIFNTLSDSTGTYDSAKKALNDYFEPKKDVTWERLQFRRTLPVANESVHEYVIRLKQKSKYCGFSEGDVDNQIRDQVVDKWPDSRIKRKWCGESDLKLEKLLDIARTYDVEADVANIDRAESVSRVKSGRQQPGTSRGASGHSGATRGASGYSGGKSKTSCYRCGKPGHFQRECPHKDKTCYRCKNIGHLANVCHTRRDSMNSDAPGTSSQGSAGKKVSKQQQQRKFIRATHENSEDEEDEETEGRGGNDNGYFVFPVNEFLEKECYDFNVEGQRVNIMPDSGAQVTLMPKTVYNKHDNFPPLHKCTKPVFAYMCKQPLSVCGQFYGEITEPVSGNQSLHE